MTSQYRTAYRPNSIVREESTAIGTKHVAVIYGGMSAEREVSLMSYQNIVAALIGLNYKVTSIDMGADIGSVIANIKPDVVFNGLYGTFGEDGGLPGLLNIMHIPYTHSGVMSSSICFNKEISRSLFANYGISSPKTTIVHKSQKFQSDPIPRPYVIKPISEGSSIGVHIVFEEDDFNFADYKFQYGDKIILEPYIKGQEINIAVLNGVALGDLEIEVIKGRFYDYTAKYNDGYTKHIVPSRISEPNRSKILKISEDICYTLGCRGIVRVEYFYSAAEDKFYILEINTHPGMTPLSICPEIAAVNGMSFNMLIDELIKSARTD